jgi:hypothetical protein
MGCVVMPQEQLPYIPPPFCLHRLGNTRAVALTLILISLGRSLVAAIIARYSFAAAADLPL